MTLSELRLTTLDLIRKTKFQLNRASHEDGMSDSEFIDEILAPLEMKICADRQMAKILRKRKN